MRNRGLIDSYAIGKLLLGHIKRLSALLDLVVDLPLWPARCLVPSLTLAHGTNIDIISAARQP